jgi:hypothetical protein
MYTTTVKNRELQARLTALDTLAGGKLGGGVVFQVARLVKTLSAQWEMYSTERDKLLTEGVERDEEGNPIKVDETRVRVKPDYLVKLQDLDAEDGDTVKCLLRSTLSANAELSVTLILGLGDLIYDDVEENDA